MVIEMLFISCGQSQWLSLYDERRRAVNSCSSAADCIDRCNKLVEQLQNALDKLPITETAEETVDHVMLFQTNNIIMIFIDMRTMINI